MTTRIPFHVTVPLVLCVLFFAAGSEGCSFISVSGPPARYRELDTFLCTASYSAPEVDLLVGAGTAVLSAAALMSHPRQTRLGLVSAGYAVLFTTSTVYGFTKVSACRHALEERELENMRERSSSFDRQLQGAPPDQPPRPRNPLDNASPGASASRCMWMPDLKSIEEPCTPEIEGQPREFHIVDKAGGKWTGKAYCACFDANGHATPGSADIPVTVRRRD